MVSLTVRGPFHGPTGHDRHVRAFARELHAQGLDIELIDLPAWSAARLPADLIDPFFDELARPVHSQTALHFCMPHQAVRIPGKLNANFTMFEATRVPAIWVEANRQHDLVIVPTESSRLAWIASGLPANRLRLCPLGIDPHGFDRPTPMELTFKPRVSVSQYRTRVLNVSELSPRKNITGLLASWTLATTPQDDAILLLKLSTCTEPPLLRLQQQIVEMERDIGKRMTEAAPVLVLGDIFSDATMPSLYAAATHYISMSLGEGWDQATMEGGAAGLRVIAPDHSGYQGYLDSAVATLLPSREVPVEYDGDPTIAALFDGSCWWQPDREAAIAAIRSAIDGRDAKPASLRDKILQQFTWEHATRRLIKILSEAEDLRAKIGASFSLLRSSKTPASEPAPTPLAGSPVLDPSST